MEKQVNEKKRMNYYVSPEVAELFQLFYEAQDPPLNKSVLHEITLTRGMFFDGEYISELKILLTQSWDLLQNHDKYMGTHWDKMAKKWAVKMKDLLTDLEPVK